MSPTVGGLTAEQKVCLKQLRADDEAIAASFNLAQRFAGMVRDLTGKQQDVWLAETESCKVRAKGRFAARPSLAGKPREVQP